MAWEPAVLAAAQLWEPHSALQETVPATVKFHLSRKPTRLNPNAGHLRQNLRVNSNGAQRVATYGSIKAAVIIRSAEKEVPVTEEHVDGLTTSQVHHDDLLSSCELTKKISGKTCPFPGSLPHGSWTCEMQEIPIHGISFLDEDAQSYPGELGYFWPAIYSTSTFFKTL